MLALASDRRRGELGDPLKSDRLRNLLEAVVRGETIDGGRDAWVLFDNELDRTSGLPGPRPNLPLLKALGTALQGHGALSQPVTVDLRASKKLAHLYVGTFALAAAAYPAGEKVRLHELLDASDDPEHDRRLPVLAALEDILAARGDEAVEILLPFADGYLHMGTLLEASTTPRALNAMKSGSTLLALFDAAWELVGGASRATERSQGYRSLREAMPAQLAKAARRFVEVADWVAQKAAITEVPQSRAILDEAIRTLRPQVGDADASRLRASFDAAGKPPRDPSRIVQGTRKRSRGR